MLCIVGWGEWASYFTNSFYNELTTYVPFLWLSRTMHTKGPVLNCWFLLLLIRKNLKLKGEIQDLFKSPRFWMNKQGWETSTNKSFNKFKIPYLSIPLLPMGPLFPICARLSVSLVPHWHHWTFFGTFVFKVKFKHLRQPT